MERDLVDFKRSIFTVSGSNLAFESAALVGEYVMRELGVDSADPHGLSCLAGDFESGAQVMTYRYRGREIKVLARRVVTRENLDSAIERGW